MIKHGKRCIQKQCMQNIWITLNNTFQNKTQLVKRSYIMITKCVNKSFYYSIYNLVFYLLTLCTKINLTIHLCLVYKLILILNQTSAARVLAVIPKHIWCSVTGIIVIIDIMIFNNNKSLHCPMNTEYLAILKRTDSTKFKMNSGLS